MTSFVSQATGTNSVAPGTVAAKQQLFVWHAREGSGGFPGLISGMALAGQSVANSCPVRLSVRPIYAGETSLGSLASSSGTNMISHVYQPASGHRLEVGNMTFRQHASGDWTYDAVTFVENDTTSWAVGFGEHRSGNTNMEDVPSGMTARSNHQTASNEASGHDTNGGVTGWSAQTVTFSTGSDSASATCVVELREIPDGVGARPLGFDSSTADDTSFTFSSKDMGDADDGDFIYVTVAGRYAGSTPFTVTGVTVDGVAASSITQDEQTGASAGVVVAIAKVAAPASAADIVVTFSGTVVRCGVYWYRGTGDLHASNSNPTTGTDPSTTVNTVAGGFVLGIAITSAASNYAIWSGMAGDPGYDLESLVHIGGAHFTAANDETGRAIAVDFNSPSAETLLLVASFEAPAAAGARRISLPLLGVG